MSVPNLNVPAHVDCDNYAVNRTGDRFLSMSKEDEIWWASQKLLCSNDFVVLLLKTGDII